MLWYVNPGKRKRSTRRARRNSDDTTDLAGWRAADTRRRAGEAYAAGWRRYGDTRRHAEWAASPAGRRIAAHNKRFEAAERKREAREMKRQDAEDRKWARSPAGKRGRYIRRSSMRSNPRRVGHVRQALGPGKLQWWNLGRPPSRKPRVKKVREQRLLGERVGQYGVRYRAVENPRKKRKGTSMPKKRRKLYGAALAAHRRKRTKAKRRTSASYGSALGTHRAHRSSARGRRAVAIWSAYRNPGRARLAAKIGGYRKKRRGRRSGYKRNPSFYSTPGSRGNWDETFGPKRKKAKKRASRRRSAAPGNRRSRAAPRRAASGRFTHRALRGDAQSVIQSAIERKRARRSRRRGSSIGAAVHTFSRTPRARFVSAGAYTPGWAKKKKRGGKSMAKKRRKGKRVSAKRRRAGLKAARTRARNRAARRHGKYFSRNPRRRRRYRRNPGMSLTMNPRRRRRRRARRNPGFSMMANPRRRRRSRRNPSRGYRRRALKRLRKDRPMLRRRHRKQRRSPIARYIRRHRMYSNPSFKGMLDVVKQALPVAGAFYAGRLLANKVTSIPAVGGLVGKLGTHAGPAIALATLAAGGFATAKVAPLRKYTGAIMTGLGLNFVFTLIDTYAPQNVKTFIGVGDDQLYDEALADYQADLGDYTDVEGYESAEGLGGMEDLGALGPVGRSSQFRQIGQGPGENDFGGGIFSSANGGWGG